ncbi:DUF5984 family protein [Actinoplanes sp. NPDC048988]|uniref:DUF5984 family protein n=1 Tax=Actinoplanes sp. NPDC048988 TaxID=3363901 RepID=UPI00372317A6
MDRTTFDYQVRLSLSALGPAQNHRVDAELVIETPFLLSDRAGRRHKLDPGSGAALAPALDLFQRTVTAVDIRADGALHLTFGEGFQLSVAPHPDYESWSLTGTGVTPITIGPGGRPDGVSTPGGCDHLTVIEFRFELYPLGEVSPWGGERPALHWFGLTEGWYWIEVNGHELLRRTRADGSPPYVDYYVARLWEDVNVLTPAVLEVVPGTLQPFIASEWKGGNLPWSIDEELAAEWYSEHYLDFGYIRNPPSVRLWRTVDGDRDEVTLDWRHEDDGEIGFTAGPTVRVSVPAANYLEAVRTLDRELMTAMRQRIDELRQRGGLPGIELDLATLEREHEDRTKWLGLNLARSPGTDWKAVMRGAKSLGARRDVS